MTYCALIVALILRPHKASLLFVMSATLFQVVCGELGGELYFMLAAVCDFMVAGLIFHSPNLSKKSLFMILISLISLCLNLIGWLAWWFYQPTTWYVGSFEVLYAVAIVTILKKDEDDGGHFAFHF